MVDYPQVKPLPFPHVVADTAEEAMRHGMLLNELTWDSTLNSIDVRQRTDCAGVWELTVHWYPDDRMQPLEQSALVGA